MKKYDINKMLEEWGGNIATSDPFPRSDEAPEDTDQISAANIGDMATNQPGPGNPENIPGPDKKKVVKEAPGDIATPPETKKPAPKKPPMTAPDMQAPPGGMGGDPSMDGMDPSMMDDPSMMGMGMQSGPTDVFEVGRIYELKKIYSRLVSMQSYLSGTTDPNLIKLRNYVSGTMDLFRTLISNVALYKDRMDEIIVVFYKVVDNVYAILSKYYKDKDSGKMVQAVE